MSKIGVTLKINVMAIEKARLFEGKKGKYLDATVFIDLADLDQYGNSGMITQGCQQRRARPKSAGEHFRQLQSVLEENGQAPQAAPQKTQYQQNNPQQPVAGGRGPAPIDDFDDDIPFARLHWMEGG